MNKKLLSITIPTWNRAETLDVALSHLLPQVLNLKEYIEVIISDNFSTDNTKEIIKKYVNEYSEIEFKLFYQSENTGFFGNFRKCKELSSGKFFWILSDDDFIQPNILEKIINCLKNDDSDFGLLYLNNNDSKSINHENKAISEIFNKFNFNLTLASSVIFFNEKQNDNFIYENFNKSNLIGFALLVDVIRYKSKATILSGYLLKLRQAEIKGYNIFDAFVFDISKILSYMLTIGYSKKIIKNFKEKLVKDLWLKRYFYLKANGKMDGGLLTYPLNEANKILKQYYKDTLNYWLLIFPLVITPRFVIKLTFPNIEKLRNFLRK